MRAAQWEEENRCLATLIASARAGSTSAFEELYDKTARVLLAHVRRLVVDGQAEDVLTEVFLQVWHNLAAFDANRGPVMVWLRVIATSRALDHLRQDKRNAARITPVDDTLDDIPDPADGPEQLFARAQDARLVHLSLAGASLSAHERTVVGLAYFRERTQQEIASTMGLPLGTVKSIMQRAQEKLRARFIACSAPAAKAAVEPRAAA
ncbi:RNA polymerase sigma factor [Ramlibacter sp. XY19]|uniref:RNA polymerase sigma factor n=1 Tax=Ramlibacter paludis TaxID=2908000 RepID=UPI0023DCDF40|nr:RNA polymerase sigma factor [Ramlibacter paludis]